jgi:hypothetical protein
LKTSFLWVFIGFQNSLPIKAKIENNNIFFFISSLEIPDIELIVNFNSDKIATEIIIKNGEEYLDKLLSIIFDIFNKTTTKKIFKNFLDKNVNI